MAATVGTKRYHTDTGHRVQECMCESAFTSDVNERLVRHDQVVRRSVAMRLIKIDVSREYTITLVHQIRVLRFNTGLI